MGTFAVYPPIDLNSIFSELGSVLSCFESSKFIAFSNRTIELGALDRSVNCLLCFAIAITENCLVHNFNSKNLQPISIGGTRERILWFEITI